jgi:hypothetical protein
MTLYLYILILYSKRAAAVVIVSLFVSLLLPTHLQYDISNENRKHPYTDLKLHKCRSVPFGHCSRHLQMSLCGFLSNHDRHLWWVCVLKRVVGKENTFCRTSVCTCTDCVSLLIAASLPPPLLSTKSKPRSYQWYTFAFCRFIADEASFSSCKKKKGVAES